MRKVEALAVALFALAAAAAVCFVVVYIEGADTQLLGICMGVALGSIAAALILIGKVMLPVPDEAEERPAFARPGRGAGGSDVKAAPARELAGAIEESAQPVTRRRLLLGAGGVAGAALGAAVVAPVASLGPGASALRESPWREGVRLVDESDVPVTASELTDRAFITAFAEGGSRDQLSSAVVVVRVALDELDLPEGREDWAPDGIMAYSKTCTHAGCAVNLYRTPLYPPLAPVPALVCPCHYSTFDIAKGAKVIFGPAGRPLPQLPLRIDAQGHLVAAGELSGPVGPAWRGVRET